MDAQFDASRRRFLQSSGAAVGGLIVAFTVPGAMRFAAAQAPAAPSLPAPNAFLRIAADDSVTVLLSHSEMGQGVWTTLPMLINEELEADWSKIKVEHAPAAPAYAHTAFGMQMTGGSTSTSSEFNRYRQVGAMTRALLVEAAAQRFGVDVAQCRVEQGVVIAGDKRARYGELAEAAAKLPAPATVVLKDPKQFKRIGQPTKRLDTPEKISGRAKFGMDIQFPGLLTAVVARAPVFGGSVKSFNADKAKAIAGVRDVVQVPSGVAVLGDHYWAAKLGRDALEIEWDLGPNTGLDSTALREQFRTLGGTDGAIAAQAGDAIAALGKAKHKYDLEFDLPYLAHAPMEPLNCTVKLAADRCEIWAGTQFQTGDQMAAAQITGLRPEQIEIHTPFLGGGFGRRANPVSDFVSEAVHVAKASGKPVKVVWSREDDVRGGYYRPAWYHRIAVGTDDQGLPIAWHHSIVGQSIIAGTPFAPMMIKDGVDATSVEGVADSPYLKSLADKRIELQSPATGIPVLWWRSVGHSHTAFAMESAIDELAHAAKVDPLAYRRGLLKEHPRHLGALNLAAEKAGWGKPLGSGRARGIAVHESFGSFVAQVAEVSVEAGTIKVHRVVCAIDCGVAVNPEGIRAQMESGIAFGLAATLHSALTFKDGRVQQSNFHDYTVLRMNAMPQVEVHIVASNLPSGGAGEPGTPPIAPAVANAVFALTGKRVRELPLKLPT